MDATILSKISIPDLPPIILDSTHYEVESSVVMCEKATEKFIRVIGTENFEFETLEKLEDHEKNCDILGILGTCDFDFTPILCCPHMDHLNNEASPYIYKVKHCRKFTKIKEPCDSLVALTLKKLVEADRFTFSTLLLGMGTDNLPIRKSFSIYRGSYEIPLFLGVVAKIIMNNIPECISSDPKNLEMLIDGLQHSFDSKHYHCFIGSPDFIVNIWF